MNLYHNNLYMEDVLYVCGLDLPWEKLKDKSVMLSGATGLLGSFLIDVLLEKNLREHLNCTVYALGRNKEKARTRFSKYIDDSRFVFIPYDVKLPLTQNDLGRVDFVLHLASNTHPVQYSTDPIGTIATNIIGVQNMLEFAVAHHATRFAFASSNEIYGENRGDCECFTEDYCGYIDCNTLRAGYPESKRCGEALCQAYSNQCGLDVVIPRFTRSYGPTLLPTDTKALSQFLHNALENHDIILKSNGLQHYSYTYATDAVAGFLTVLLKGKSGEAYNIADVASDVKLRDLAQYVADLAGVKVVFDLPGNVESAGFSKVCKARLDSAKLQRLGWKAKWDIQSGLERTFRIWQTAMH